MANKLKKCPFCGGEAYVYGKKPSFGVECSNCRVTLSNLDSKKEAVKAWNERLTLDLTKEELDKIVELCLEAGWLASPAEVRILDKCGEIKALLESEAQK